MHDLVNIKVEAVVLTLKNNNHMKKYIKSFGIMALTCHLSISAYAQSSDEMLEFDLEEVPQTEPGSMTTMIIIPPDEIETLDDILKFQKDYCKKHFADYEIHQSSSDFYDKLFYSIDLKKGNLLKRSVYFDPSLAFEKIKAKGGSAKKEIETLVEKKRQFAEYLKKLELVPLKENVLGSESKPIVVKDKSIKDTIDVSTYVKNYCENQYKGYEILPPQFKLINEVPFYIVNVEKNHKMSLVYFDLSKCFEQLRKKDKKLGAEVDEMIDQYKKFIGEK